MTNQTPQYDPEIVTKTTIDPTKGLYGFQFPAGTSKEDKDFLIVQIAEAKRLGKHLEIDSRVKVIDLTREPTPAPVTPPVAPPAPIATPVQPPTQPVTPPPTTPPVGQPLTNITVAPVTPPAPVPDQQK